MLLGERGKKLLATVRQNKIRRSLRHILRFEKGGRPVKVLDHVTFEGAAKQHKSNDALHPDSLWSSLAPYEEIIAPGVRLDSIKSLQDLAIVEKAAPAKVLSSVFDLFLADDLKGVNIKGKTSYPQNTLSLLLKPAIWRWVSMTRQSSWMMMRLTSTFGMID
eukprot:15348007-Ditylum_brightwellii.AAC.1